MATRTIKTVPAGARTVRTYAGRRIYSHPDYRGVFIGYAGDTTRKRSDRRVWRVARDVKHAKKIVQDARRKLSEKIASR